MTDLLCVADDAYAASLLAVEACKGLHDEVEAVLVEVSEALVDEEGAYGEASAGDVGEGKGKGEADEEGFAAAEGADVAALVEHVAVDDLEVECAGEGAEFVARGELPQPLVGALGKDAEREALRETAEPLAVGTSEECVQTPPLLKGMARGEQGFLLGLSLLKALLVGV